MGDDESSARKPHRTQHLLVVQALVHLLQRGHSVAYTIFQSQSVFQNGENLLHNGTSRPHEA
jgi:hypothetical protein